MYYCSWGQRCFNNPKHYIHKKDRRESRIFWLQDKISFFKLIFGVPKYTRVHQLFSNKSRKKLCMCCKGGEVTPSLETYTNIMGIETNKYGVKFLNFYLNSKNNAILLWNKQYFHVSLLIYSSLTEWHSFAVLSLRSMLWLWCCAGIKRNARLMCSTKVIKVKFMLATAQVFGFIVLPRKTSVKLLVIE